MNKILLLGLIIGLGFSCSVKTDKKIEESEALPDRLFALKNIEDADLIYNNIRYIDEGLYLDSSKKIEFVELNTVYKEKILSPILKQDLGVDKDYVKSFMQSYFISKQDKIGDYQPLIIWTSGDDYTSLILTLVDSTLNPVSHMVLNGGFLSGPFEVNDSLTSWEDEKHSKIDGNTIHYYSLTNYIWSDSRNDSAFVDSITYISKILQNGQINTEKIDSVRMVKSVKY